MTSADASRRAMANEDTSRGKKLNEEQKAAAVRRLYDEEIRLKVEKHQQLVKKVYREEPAKVIPSTQLQESVTRQHDAEMSRREAKREELKQKYYKTAPPQTMQPEDIENSIQRIYTDAIRHKDDSVKRLDQRYAFKRKDEKRMEAGALKESVDRLAKAKKKDYTDDEINRIYGF